MIRIPSVKTIAIRLKIDRKRTREIRNALEFQYETPPRLFRPGLILERVNEIMGAFGVERIERESDGRAAALYVNVGDPYDNTVLYDSGRETYYVCSWGDWLEIYEKRRGKLA